MIVDFEYIGGACGLDYSISLRAIAVTSAPESTKASLLGPISKSRGTYSNSSWRLNNFVEDSGGHNSSVSSSLTNFFINLWGFHCERVVISNLFSCCVVICFLGFGLTFLGAVEERYQSVLCPSFWELCCSGSRFFRLESLWWQRLNCCMFPSL